MLNNNEFNKFGHEAIDWVSNYYQTEQKVYPVLHQVQPGEILKQLPNMPPEVGEDFNKILEDFQKIIMPGITHWQSPQFFGYFPSNTSYESMIGEILSNALGVVNFSWESSPAATELEQRVMQWLRQLIHLPECFIGVINDTASTASLTAIMTALNRVTNGKIHDEGFDGKTYRLYCTTETHSSIEKAAIMAGIGKKNVVKIETDDIYAMKIEKLEQAIDADIKKGYIPCCVVAALGTTGSLAVDPIDKIADLCNKHNIWIHVDAALSGSALILEEYSHWLVGLEKVDSLVFNPHKWLFTNFDYSAFFVKETKTLLNTFTISPEYLKFEHEDEVVNYKDWGIQLGRRFRALKMWFMLRSFGIQGIKDTLRNHIAMTKWLHEQMIQEPDIEIMAPVDLNLICFRVIKEGYSEIELNDLNSRLIKDINATGEIFLTHTKLNGKFVIRVAIGKTYAKQEHIKMAWKVIQKMIKKI